MTSRRALRRALAPAAVGIAALSWVGIAAAVEGNLYPVSPSGPAAVASGVQASSSGGVHTVTVAAADPSLAGERWGLAWTCLPGTELALVRFGALRSTEASSLEVRVAGDGGAAWALPDIALPQSPAAGVLLAPSVAPGSCVARLSLNQVESRRQHRRTYFIDRPEAWVRDVAPPVVHADEVSTPWHSSAAYLSWVVSDNMGLDGMGSVSIHLGERTLWTGPASLDRRGASLSLDGVPDGRHEVVIEARGDGTASGVARRTIGVDRTPPTVIAVPVTHTTVPRRVRIGWATYDASSGVHNSEVQIATGSSWTTVASATSAGSRSVDVDLPPDLPDGAYTWRVVTRDGAFNSTVTPGPDPILVDTAAPSIAAHWDQQGWLRAASIDVTTDDNLAARLGLGPFGVEAAVPDGWRLLKAGPGAAGRRTVELATDLADGRHRLRISQANAAPFGHIVRREVVTLNVDRAAPRVTRAAFEALPQGPIRASWHAEDATSGTARAIVQWHTGTEWRTLGAGATGEGAGALVVDAAALAGERPRMRVVVVDVAGNPGVDEGAITDAPAPSGGALGSAAPDPLAHLDGARLSVAVPGARPVTGRAGGRTLTATITSGGLVRMVGRLRDAAGADAAGVEIEARGHRGVVLGRGRTDDAGRVRLSLRPEAGAVLRIGVPSEGRLRPLATTASVRVRVRPRIVLTAPALPVRTGERVVFTGRVYPAPGRLGLSTRKGVVLEWRDPIRGVWRPVVNAPMRRDGTFSIPWRFALRGLAVPMRVRVPGEIGWPLMPALSRAVVVTPQ